MARCRGEPGIETGVDWATDLVKHILANGITRVEPRPEAEAEWTEHVREMSGISLMSTARSWFNGYNSNVEGHDKIRHIIYNGGAPRYRKWLEEAAEDEYAGFLMD